MPKAKPTNSSSYQRGQIEEAISCLIEPELVRPSPLLRAQIKRLIDVDRRLVQTLDGHRPAFLTVPLPQRGTNVTFTAYGAFALLTGVRVMRHGWPQRKVVKLMSAVRRDMQREHRRTMRQDPKALFDFEAIKAAARPGDVAHDSVDPVVLRVRAVPSDRGIDLVGDVFRVGDTQRASRSLRPPYTEFDLVGTAFRLAEALSTTSPRSRGRPSSITENVPSSITRKAR